MARGLQRTTLEIDVRRDAGSGKWCFVLIGAGRRIVHESDFLYDTQVDARAAARDWLTQILLR